MSNRMRALPLDPNSAAYEQPSSAASQRASACPGLLWVLYRDYRRYRATGARNVLSVVLLTQGFWATVVFRISHWAKARLPIPGLRLVVNAGCVMLQKITEVVTGISIPAECQIGAGLYIGHFGGIFIDAESRLGHNCNLSQGVTLGQGGRGELWGAPVLGNRVHVGANAVVLGKITIGDDAVIGPGAVVMNSVPARGIAMGNPARVVGELGSFELVIYDEMESDPNRKEGLQGRDAGSG